MILLHQIGSRINSNFNYLGEIQACEEPLSFDGIYESVYKNYRALKGKDIIFFIMGAFVGGNNKFDVMQPISNYCTWEQLFEMAKELGAEMGYHGLTHRDLTLLQDDEVRAEIEWPKELSNYPGLKKFAYPYGAVNERIANLVKEAGYYEAFSVFQGDGSQFQRKRRYLNW